ncbi:MAG: 30S ribosomal protein S6 [Bacillota bacterium]|jgi:small subunit ribosomal protein S6|nr:30S ribosomal protein S6 [Bacillota bacterium]
MELYEIMFIFRPDVEAEQQEEVINTLNEVIVKNQGEVKGVFDWRKRRLSYEINKHTEGHYYLLYFYGQGLIIPELEHFFKVTDEIIRFMVVRAEEEDFEAFAKEKSSEEVTVEEPKIDSSDQESEIAEGLEKSSEDVVKETDETDQEEKPEVVEVEQVKDDSIDNPPDTDDKEES